MESVGCCFAILSFCHPLIFKWIWCNSAPKENFTLVLLPLESLFTDCNKSEVVALRRKIGIFNVFPFSLSPPSHNAWASSPQRKQTNVRGLESSRACRINLFAEGEGEWGGDRIQEQLYINCTFILRIGYSRYIITEAFD